MSIFRLTPDQFETFTLTTNPTRTFFSGSGLGVTGSVYLFARRSATEKDLRSSPSFIDTTADDASLDSYRLSMVQSAATSSDIGGLANIYLSKVNSAAQAARKSKYLDILRITPSTTFTTNTVKKSIIRNSLMSYYRSAGSSMNWAFTNYHSLNFFTASSIPSQSGLLYPNVNTRLSSSTYAYGAYVPTGSLSIEFYINPRYSCDSSNGQFHAGTICFLSSTYALSLISGSLRDYNGYTDGFRLQLQLSRSADFRPSTVNPGVYPRDLVFRSNDNSLRRNHWHHVVVRWGTNTIDNGTGSFIIDGVEQGTFIVPSGSIALLASNPLNPGVLCIGNYYEGNNSGANSLAQFFGTDSSTREGLVNLVATAGGVDNPTIYNFTQPLNAEIHDLAIFEHYLTDDEIAARRGKGLTSLQDCLFYLPPFFTAESPYRKYVGSYGGVLQTPFYALNGTTREPFNAALSFNVNAHYINLENFTRDFVTQNYPRAFVMTASEITTTTTARPANDFLYDNPGVARRNVTILPCDDGNFVPNFSWITQYTSGTDRYGDDLGIYDPSLITLNDLVPTSSFYPGIHYETGSLFNAFVGATPEAFSTIPSRAYTIYQRTGDNSSNACVMFNISNLFYGNRILPGTFWMRDMAITGTNERVSLTFRDDGYGSLYRADCATSASTWNNCGNIFYNEGIVVLKTPMVPFFGKTKFELGFKGEQNLHIFTINAFALANTLNSSSNPSYQPLSATLNANEPEEGFVYIDSVNFHDDNLNVVMKAQLAQPILKRTGDRFLFRSKLTF